MMGFIHGEAYRRTPEYLLWLRIKARCFYKRHKSYRNYGGRGIMMCPLWRKSFIAFLHDVGRRLSSHHSLDRIDNDKGYFPDNVKWSTRKEQARNKRNNRVIEISGHRRCLSEWEELSGIGRVTILYRLRRGWSAEEAISKSPKGPRLITVSGEKKRLYEWSRLSGVSAPLILHRIRLGWSNKDAVFERPRAQRKAGP